MDTEVGPIKRARVRRLEILAPARYLWTFNGPRSSIHNIHRRTFLPLNKWDSRFEGATVFQPFPAHRFDLIHAFNRIPVGSQPYVIGFESHLPRSFWFESSHWHKALCHSLASDRCRAIVAISLHAERIFREVHADSPDREALMSKLTRRLPNFPPPQIDDIDVEGDKLRLFFVGSHLARKGGCVALRVAEIAHSQGIPIRLEIISSLKCGGGIWTDPPDTDFFRPYLDLLNTPNVIFRQGASNDQVLAAVRKAHFSILTTFSDTFGFSAIESMMHYTPVIGTRQGALPEFIQDGVNGLLIDLPTTDRGEWIHSSSSQRHTTAFKNLYRDEIERLARESLAALNVFWSDKERYRRMRKAARRTAEALFDAADATKFWDDLYLRALPGTLPNSK